MATEDDKPNSGLIGTITIAGAISMVAICAVLTALVRSEQHGEDTRKGAAADTKPYAEMVDTQRKTMSAGPSYVDDTKERIAIPIDRAMAAVVKEISENPESATPPSDKPQAVEDAGADAGDAGADAEPGDAQAAKEEGAKEEAPKLPAPKKQGGEGTVPPPGEAPEN